MWVPIIHFNGIASPSHHHHLARGAQFPMACVHWWKQNKGHQIKSSVPKNAVVITRIAYRQSETVRERFHRKERNKSVSMSTFINSKARMNEKKETFDWIRYVRESQHNSSKFKTYGDWKSWRWHFWGTNSIFTHTSIKSVTKLITENKIGSFFVFHFFNCFYSWSVQVFNDFIAFMITKMNLKR